MSETIETKRPLIITVICVILFIGAMMASRLIVSEEFAALPGSIRAVYFISVILTVVSVLGFFLMRRWGVILYILVTIAGQAVLMKSGYWNPIQLLLALIFIAVGLAYFRQMK